jgi:D-glycero-D-manno-heptose 1,7-bisphosphate phosphatase
MNKALFMDRDGVINKEISYLFRIQDFEFINGVFEACIFFQDRGYLLFIITNQAGIARGYYSEDQFHQLNNWMLEQFEEQGIFIAKVYYSPYHPIYGIGRYRQESNCRKPAPGMIIQARDEFNIDLTASILVGDKESDIEAGCSAGVGINVLVRSGHVVNGDYLKADVIIDSIQALPLVINRKGCLI